MRQAITTKYLGATNHRGSRVKASAQAGSVTISWDDGRNQERNHLAAAKALADRYGWLDYGLRMVAGGLPDGTGNVYVFDDTPLAKVELNDWRDVVIDALIEERYEAAVEIIKEEMRRSGHGRR